MPNCPCVVEYGLKPKPNHKQVLLPLGKKTPSMLPPMFPDAWKRKLIHLVPLESELEKLTNCLPAPELKALLATGRPG